MPDIFSYVILISQDTEKEGYKEFHLTANGHHGVDTMKKFLIFFVAVSLLIPLAGAYASPITVDLWNAFPDAQGQGGFFAQYLSADGQIYPKDSPKFNSL